MNFYPILTCTQHFELLIFRSKGVTPEAYLTIETQHQSSPIACMVMSRDDKYVAFTLEDQIRVFDISSGRIHEVHLGGRTNYSAVKHAHTSSVGVHVTGHSDIETGQLEKSAETVIARRLQFSVDGRRFIVATHLGNQYAYVDMWDCTGHQWKFDVDCPKSFKLPPVCDMLEILRLHPVLIAHSGLVMMVTLPAYSTTASTKQSFSQLF
jgi:hypothetical protein